MKYKIVDTETQAWQWIDHHFHDWREDKDMGLIGTRPTILCSVCGVTIWPSEYDALKELFEKGDK